MMTTIEALQHEPYFEEWCQDVHRLYSYDEKVMAMTRTIEGNCKTLEDALVMLVSYKAYPYFEPEANFLFADIIDFLMLDI